MVSRKENKSNSAVLRLTFATVVAFALTGVAILVQASTQMPAVPGSQRFLELSGTATNQSITELANQLNVIAYAGTSSNDDILKAAKTLPLTPVDNTPSNNKLVENKLAEPLVVNVNVFMLSHRVTNQSQLAELQMQPFFGEFDSALFKESSAPEVASIATSVDAKSVGAFAGIGFPHIETNARANADRYKPYKQLLSFVSDEYGAIVPHIKCMGLSPQRVAKRAEKYHEKIYDLAVKHNVSVSLVKAVVAKESCFNPAAVSHVGAIGLMQLMPETASWLNVRQPENADQNLEGGVRYLAQLRKRFGSNELALAAYNAGPGNVERYNGIPPFAETQNYVQDVLYFYRGYVATTRFVNARNTIEL